MEIIGLKYSSAGHHPFLHFLIDFNNINYAFLINILPQKCEDFYFFFFFNIHAYKKSKECLRFYCTSHDFCIVPTFWIC